MFEVLNAALPNGLQIYLHRMPETQTIACGLWFCQGSKYEDDSTNGLSHLVEHLVFNLENGNEGFKELFQEATSKGVAYNAVTAKEYTAYYYSGLKGTIGICLNLLRKIAGCRGEFDRSFIDNERKVVIQEATGYYSSFNQIKERMGQALWGNQDVGRIIMGDINNVKNASDDILSKIISDSYTPENAKLVVVGDIQYSEVLKKIEDIFSSWEARPTRKYTSIVDKEPGIYFNAGGSGNAVVALGFRVGDISSYEQTQVNLISKIIGDSSLESRLVREVRMNRGLAYTVGAFNNIYSRRGTLGFSAVVDNSKVDETVKIMTSILNDIKVNGFTNEEIEMQKRIMETNVYLALGNVTEQLRNLGSQVVFGKNSILENELHFIRKITNEDLIEVFNEIFIEEKMGFAAIGKFDIENVIENIQLG